MASLHGEWALVWEVAAAADERIGVRQGSSSGLVVHGGQRSLAARRLCLCTKHAWDVPGD
jgi:hypothetical protein